MFGDSPMDQVQNFNAHDVAKKLDTLGKANSTVKNYVSSLSGLLTWATTNVRNHNQAIEKQWIASNAFAGVSLEDWGA